MSDDPAALQERQSGLDATMEARPRSKKVDRQSGTRLAGKVAVISGGDSGVGRAVAIDFAREGADIAILWREEVENAAETARLIEAEGRRVLSLHGDVGDPSFCRSTVAEIVDTLGGIDILVNDTGIVPDAQTFEEISDEQLEHVFRSNVFGQFFLTRAALPLIPEGGVIINGVAPTTYEGGATMIDSASSAGAIIAFTRALANALRPRRIRVNAVESGPIRAEPLPEGSEPDDIAPCYLFLASDDAGFMTGQVLNPTGGVIVTS